MANKMLIDATHPEETRVVVLKGDRVEEFDLESQDKRQLRGNIYLAKVTRVEPSLQAAFVDYGGNRHGFLAFSEIHPDYYQIPVADRRALLEEVQADADDDDDDVVETPAPAKAKSKSRSRKRKSSRAKADEAESAAESSPAEAEASAAEEPPAPEDKSEAGGSDGGDDGAEAAETAPEATGESAEGTADASDADAGQPETEAESDAAPVEASSDDTDDQKAAAEDGDEPAAESASGDDPDTDNGADDKPARRPRRRRRSKTAAAAATTPTVTEEFEDTDSPAGGDVESIGAEDALEELPSRRTARRKIYKIQEVIRRRQILLVQVVKEERGTKGAALTTYLSLAGRYCVLMPNTARGGGISRKITNPTDRRRLKTIASDLEVPEGTGVIVRTAGAQRTKAEIKRDFEYLLRMWESIRDLTLKSTAPSLIYEEGSLVKRSIRDLYSKDIDEVQVEGEEAYKEGKAFMRMLMPSHAKNVKQYKEPEPLFTRFRVESQLDQMFSPVVTLKSGGYLVINQTEALVAVDVNSGRSTREHNIEDTALKTNLEAAAEVARQLRLRDLAGLIVIDFIDMEEKRNNRSVEKKLKDCLKSDRARIQVGRISHFGLLEMSRQRIRASVLEGTMEQCIHCQGTGRVRSVGSTALQIVRALEEQAITHSGRDLTIRTNTEIALYMLNQKRAHLTDIERRFAIRVDVAADATNLGSSFTIERGAVSDAAGGAATGVVQIDSVFDSSDDADAEAEAASEAQEDGEAGRKRRRRRRRKRSDETSDTGVEAAEAEARTDTSGEDEEQRPRRRRGRRGGRRRRGEGAVSGEPGAPISWAWQTDDAPEPAPAEETAEETAEEHAQPVVEESTDVAPQESDEVPEGAGEAAEAPATDGLHPALTGEPGGMADTPVLEEAATTRVAEVSVDSDADGLDDSVPDVSPQDPDRPSKKGWWQRRFVPNRQA